MLGYRPDEESEITSQGQPKVRAFPELRENHVTVGRGSIYYANELEKVS